MHTRVLVESTRSRRLVPLHRLWVGGLACGGVVLTHTLAYLLAAPDPQSRRQLLLATGHRYWPYFSALALGAVVAGLAQFTLRRFRHARPADNTVRQLFGPTAGRLIALQAIGFLGVEAFEGVFVHGDLTEVLAEPVIPLGLLVQTLVAALAALLLILVARAVDLVARLIRPKLRRIRVPVLPAPRPMYWPRLAPATGGPTLRGPPPLLPHR
jgi:hypothetical protein